MEHDKDVPPPLNYSVGYLGVLSPSAKSFTLFRGTVLGRAVLEVRPDMIQTKPLNSDEELYAGEDTATL